MKPVHSGINTAFEGRLERLDLRRQTGGKTVLVYGGTEITRDLMVAHIAAGGGTVLYESPALVVEGAATDQPRILFEQTGKRREIECEFVAGCDG